MYEKTQCASIHQKASVFKESFSKFLSLGEPVIKTTASDAIRAQCFLDRLAHMHY